ncbi:hypothetical protein GJ496_007545 [Pomphorhynchus laevis]|nr:hypothetical protein GJ496_007545 [Pomphorhynchus laevis]
MGNYIRFIKRPFWKINSLNRSIKYIEKCESINAAKNRDSTNYRTSITPKIETIDESDRRNRALIENLKLLRVNTTAGLSGEQQSKIPDNAIKWEFADDQTKAEFGDHGYEEPNQIPEGCISVRRLFDLTMKFNNDPDMFTVENLALEYKLPVDTTRKLLDTYQSFSVKAQSETFTQ